MGKSTATRMLRRLGVSVHDSDAVVHELLGPKGAAVEIVSREFGLAPLGDGGISRPDLGKIVFAQPEMLRQLEDILHPLVGRDRAQFIRRMARQGRRRRSLVVLDIPLLFETGSLDVCDVICVVSAPLAVQRQRYLARPRATEQRLQSILANQMPDRYKRRLADITIPSGLGLAPTLRALRRACNLAKRANRRQLARSAARRQLSVAIIRSLNP